MNWQQSYTATWRVFAVNPNTWADGAILSNVDALDVSRTASGNLIESGSMDVSGDVPNGYYRIVMTAEQGEEIAREEIATLLFLTNSGETNYGTTTHSINGYSVLYPASTSSVLTGEYAPAGSDGAQYAASLLRDAINAPVSVDGSFYLNDHIVYELGASVIDAVWAVLDAGNFIMQIDGHGTVHICPKPTEPALVVSSSNMQMLLNGIGESDNADEIPNRYIVIDDGNIVIASNDDANSEVSTVSRGYNVDVVDTSPTPTNGQTLMAYARDMLQRASIFRQTYEYTREYAPNVYPYSIVSSSVTGMQGNLRVESQSIECGNGITVSEKASRETYLWSATTL